jgi:hypothetical protein
MAAYRVVALSTASFVLAGSLGALLVIMACETRVVPGLLLVLPIISRLPATVEVGFDSRNASPGGEKIKKENNQYHTRV